jgi:hypothetical protein
MDCHSACTAAASAYRAEGRAITTPPEIALVTASLQLAYLRPTPITEPLLLRATIREQTARKSLVTCTLPARGDVCVRAEVVMVRLPGPSGGGS